MKKFTSILVLWCTVGYSQITLTANSPISIFKKDGTLWISYDSKNATTQVFYPIEQIYNCNGNSIEQITDTVVRNGRYRLYFGSKWVEVSGKEDDTAHGQMRKIMGVAFYSHLMFRVMAACFDDNYLYCDQALCGDKFRILKKSF